jgi:hypothetical protein
MNTAPPTVLGCPPVLRPAKPRDGGAREPAELHGGTGAKKRLAVVSGLPADPPESTAELHDHAAHPAVADEDVRAAAEDAGARAVRRRRAEDARELLRVVGEDQDVRRPADPERGVACERLVGAGAVAEERPERVDQARRKRHLSGSPGWLRPARRRPRSSSAVRWMSPAPSVSTRSPGRTTSSSASATRSRADPAHVEVTAPLERVVDGFRRHAVQALLAGGVDVGQDDRVRVVERLEELREGSRVREAVRLEGDDEPAREAFAPRAA